MNLIVKNGSQIMVRQVEPHDTTELYNYLNNLSEESRQRFGPHAFDEATINDICRHHDPVIYRYIAIELVTGKIVAYMLFLKGMIEGDHRRFAGRSQFFDPLTTITFAPSVADHWQSSGLGSAMYELIEEQLKKNGMTHVVLWGGVQASNLKAVNFYKKHSYQTISSFWHDGKDNYDMVKWLEEKESQTER